MRASTVRTCIAASRADEAALALLGNAMQRLALSARAYHRVLRVARTIADLADSDVVAPRTSPRPLRCGSSTVASAAADFRLIAAINRADRAASRVSLRPGSLHRAGRSQGR